MKLRAVALSALLVGCAAARIPQAVTRTVPVTTPLPPVGTTCTVDRTELASGWVIDHFEFSSVGLLRKTTSQGPGYDTSTVYTYDAEGRLIHWDYALDYAEGEPPYADAWRPWQITPLPTFVRSSRDYTWSESGRVSGFTTRTSKVHGGEHFESEQTTTIVYDRRGRKREQLLESRSDAKVGFQRVRYDYRAGRLRTRSMRFESSSGQDAGGYEATFRYDRAGNLASTVADTPSPTTTTYTYDDRDRLGHVGAGSNPEFIWDEDRLLEERIVGWRYTYDETGRVSHGQRPDGQGFSVAYSQGCPPGFRSDAFTPNLNGFLYFEGAVLDH